MGGLLLGVLPTMRKSDLGLDNMWPSARYLHLNKIITRCAGVVRVLDQGLDELPRSRLVMLEACNSSFQSTSRSRPRVPALLQHRAVLRRPDHVGRGELADRVRPPALGRDRIALFRQAVDDARNLAHARDRGAGPASAPLGQAVLTLVTFSCALPVSETRRRAAAGDARGGRDRQERAARPAQSHSPSGAGRPCTGWCSWPGCRRVVLHRHGAVEGSVVADWQEIVTVTGRAVGIENEPGAKLSSGRR